jgi:hypothetical protein
MTLWLTIVLGCIFVCGSRSADINTSSALDSEDLGLYFENMRDSRRRSEETVLVHIHIPKAAGSALAIALSSACSNCPFERHFVACRVNSCRKVKGTRGFTFQYSVSRATRWMCGTHAPYFRMRGVPCSGNFRLADKGLRSVFLIMIREPFERYISEVVEWAKPRTGFYVDWGARLESKQIPGQPFNATAYMLEVARLPGNLLVHNRMVKMIGGTARDYNMKYQKKKTGSRWISGAKRIGAALENSKKILRRGDVILGIAARFAESLCILEILYGDLQEFRWDPNRHSHSRKCKLAPPIIDDVQPQSSFDNSPFVHLSPHFCTFLRIYLCAGHKAKKTGFNATERLRDSSTYSSSSDSMSSDESRKLLNGSHSSRRSHTLHASHNTSSVFTNSTQRRASRTDIARNSEIYTEWLPKNKEDVELYEYASSLFNAQFEAALKLYSSYSQREKQQIQVPHCEAFL